MARALQREAASTHDRLLEAALRCASEAGYLGTSTKAIAAAAGVAEVTLFRHFGSKQRLFAEMLRRHGFGSQLREMVRRFEGLPAREALLRIGIRFLATLDERQALVRITLSEICRYPEALQLTYQRFVDETVATLARYLRGRIQAGELRPLAPRSVARAYLHSLFGHYLAETVIAGRRLDARSSRRWVATLVDLLLEGARP